jgi:hypothetical protein
MTPPELHSGLELDLGHSSRIERHRRKVVDDVDCLNTIGSGELFELLRELLNGQLVVIGVRFDFRYGGNEALHFFRRANVPIQLARRHGEIARRQEQITASGRQGLPNGRLAYQSLG